MPDPFFIVGAPRSGTTLLERLLNRHSRIFVSPETEFFFRLQQGGYLHQPFSQDRLRAFLDDFLQQQPAELIGLTEMSDLEGQLLADHPRSYADVFRRLLALIAGSEGAPVHGEKTPDHLECLDYLLEAFPQSRFLLMVRDGRAVVRSRLEHPRWEHNLLDASRRWARAARSVRSALQTEQSFRMLLVSYERLLAQPDVVLQEICKLLGETYETRMLESDSEDNRSERFEAYYGQPWMSRSGLGIDPSRAEAWRDQYSPAELAVVDHEIGSELTAFGYTREAEPASGWRTLWAREWLRHQSHRVRRRVQRWEGASQ